LEFQDESVSRLSTAVDDFTIIPLRREIITSTLLRQGWATGRWWVQSVTALRPCLHEVADTIRHPVQSKAIEELQLK
jgi:hypothetical protein